MAEQVCSTSIKPNALLFHEFPLAGYSLSTRRNKLLATVQTSGPETGKAMKDLFDRISRFIGEDSIPK